MNPLEPYLPKQKTHNNKNTTPTKQKEKRKEKETTTTNIDTKIGKNPNRSDWSRHDSRKSSWKRKGRVNSLRSKFQARKKEKKKKLNEHAEEGVKSRVHYTKAKPVYYYALEGLTEIIHRSIK